MSPERLTGRWAGDQGSDRRRQGQGRRSGVRQKEAGAGQEIRAGGKDRANLFIYQARESSLVPAGFLTAQFLQKLCIMNHLL